MLSMRALPIAKATRLKLSQSGTSLVFISNKEATIRATKPTARLKKIRLNIDLPKKRRV